jgi:hypothetical protein
MSLQVLLENLPSFEARLEKEKNILKSNDKKAA